MKSEPEDNNTNASREDATPKKTFQKCDEGERVFCRQRITNVLGGNPQVCPLHPISCSSTLSVLSIFHILICKCRVPTQLQEG